MTDAVKTNNKVAVKQYFTIAAIAGGILCSWAKIQGELGTALQEGTGIQACGRG
ncbi:MAG: hypothetical protein GX334_06380 [Firmicutes bacterium]|nr:hypothetical protein [Bacillota bacterium]